MQDLCQTGGGSATTLALENIEKQIEVIRAEVEDVQSNIGAKIEKAQTNIEAKVEGVQGNIGSRIVEVGTKIEAQIQEVCTTPAPVTEGLIEKV